MKSIAKILKIVNIVLMVICGISCFVGVGLSYDNAKDKKIQQDDLTMRITNITREIEPRYNTPTVTLEYAVTSKYKYSITGLNGTLDIYDEFNSNIFHASYTKINFSMVLKKNETQSGKFSLLCNDTDKIYTADFSTLSIRYTADYVYFEEINRNSSVNFNYDMPFTAKSSNTSQNNNSSDSSNTSTHTHTYEDVWTYDEEYHWHKATCGHDDEVKDKAQHIFESEICSCGYDIGNILEFEKIIDKEEYEVVDIKNPTAKCVYIPDTYNGLPVTNIANGAFYNNAAIEKVIVGNKVKSIGNGAFQKSTNLKNVIFKGNSSLQKVGDSAFYFCYRLTEFIIPNSVTSIGEHAFRDCYVLTNITIPDGVTSIGNSAFSGCSDLTSVTIGNSVTSIGNSAFSKCSGLTNITIPDSVTNIGGSVFPDSVKTKQNGVCYVDNWVVGVVNPYLTKAQLISGTKGIADYAFADCDSLTSITIPDSVTNIGNSAFSGCSGLTNITIPGSVTNIGNSAFSGCSGLTNITIPGSVTSIADYAFYCCSSLTSITIPEGVTSIGEHAFRECSGLTNITYQGTKVQWQAIDKGSSWNYNVPYTCKIYCAD